MIGLLALEIYTPARVPAQSAETFDRSSFLVARPADGGVHGITGADFRTVPNIIGLGSGQRRQGR
jgi:hypothetical protein